MNIEKMSQKGAVQTINQIADGMKKFIANNPDSAKDLLEALVSTFEPLAGEDFFGTEGWEHGLGVS